jgi:mRNA interferase MazF
MVMRKGEIYWAELDRPTGNGPGDRRPVVVIQSDLFNASAIPTVMVAILTTNLRLAKAPGNVALSRSESGLPKDSVVNVSQILTINKDRLTELVGELDPALLFSIDNGIRLAFDV